VAAYIEERSELEREERGKNKKVNDRASKLPHMQGSMGTGS